MFWPCETRTSTCRNLATISSGLYRFLAITVLLDVRDIPQVGPLQWGWITTAVSSPRNIIETVFCSDETFSTCRFSAGGDGGGEPHCEGAARCEGERRAAGRQLAGYPRASWRGT